MFENPHNVHGQGRLDYLDGLRCLSIMAVLCFHYFSAWSQPQLGLAPYGDRLSSLFQYGYFGVEMFFMISGLVIMMTLARCRTVGEFAVRRAARLVPGMIIFSLLTFAVTTALAPNIFQVPEWGFVPSWLFLPPALLNRIFETSVFNSVDSAYWSLYVEVQFYLAVGSLYFLSTRNFYRNALIFFLLVFALADAFLFTQRQDLFELLGSVTAPKYFPWFMMGMAFYMSMHNTSRSYAVLYLVVAVLQLWILAGSEPTIARFVTPVLLPLLFCAVIKCRVLQTALSFKPLVIIGVSSYGLYLVHQAVGVLLIQHIAAYVGVTGWPSVLVAFAVTAGLVALAIGVFKYVEYPINRWAVRRWTYPR